MIRRSTLLLRFFAISVLIAAFSIAVTAWLATQTTADNIQQQSGANAVQDARLYDQLLGYAATHASWEGVRPTLDALAAQSGRRIALASLDRMPIADTGDRDAPVLPLQRDALIDPLHVDATLQPRAPANLIDRRAVARLAPLPDRYRRDLRGVADRLAKCLRTAYDIDARVASSPNGRPFVVVPTLEELAPVYDSRRCVSDSINPLSVLTSAEQEVNRQFRQGVSACLEKLPASPTPPPSSSSPATAASTTPTNVAADPRATALAPVVISASEATDSVPDLIPARLWTIAAVQDHLGYLAESPDFEAATRSCFTTALHHQLTDAVSPPALVFLTAPHGPAPATADLSRAGAARIAVTAAIVLAVAMFAAWLSATRLVRPLRAVTSAAHRMAGGDRTVRVRTKAHGEVAELADAFNAMSEQLESTERQRQALIGDIAHELRNPLGNITGWLEATHDGLATADPELIDMLLTESVLLQRLVDDLQDLAQADAGRLRLHPELTDAADIADQVAAAHQAAADERHITLRSVTRGRLPVLADPTRLRQALSNLVGNAVRYTPAGGEISVRTWADGDTVGFEVTDTGCGISAEELPHVFDRFWRSDASRSRLTGGTGLGLAITKHLCEAHGGAVSATSTVNRGSTFRITLPGAHVRPAVDPHRSG
ncbi:HAMP domain-containing sensor histidine kinase [Amorphoplanes nipponensis]|uniref:histidine kinase n=1 Tax=Actinoplanes nipponensis TaxID=135950 RepID=A0A919JCW5_9ACTN|nr:HAMP domain-containing sensor histidine kinase [Actinoplanes nipponensis]GIE47267.1 two-component sensor histidine kinase [Actinoplanes nipponensis]